MHACPRFLHLGVTVDSDALFYVLLLPTGLKQCSLCELGGLSPWLWRGSGRARPWGGDVCIPPFKMLTMDVAMLRHKDTMRDG